MTEAEKQAIETMKHWIDYEKANKEKINKADELIEIQETILNLLEKQQTRVQDLEKALIDEDYKHRQEIKKYEEEIEKVSSEFAIGKRQYEELIDDYDELNLKNIDQQKEIDKYKEMYAVSVADRVNSAFKQRYKNAEDLEMLYKGCQIELEEKDKIINKLLNDFNFIKNVDSLKYILDEYAFKDILIPMFLENKAEYMYKFRNFYVPDNKDIEEFNYRAEENNKKMLEMMQRGLSRDEIIEYFENDVSKT